MDRFWDVAAGSGRGSHPGARRHPWGWRVLETDKGKARSSPGHLNALEGLVEWGLHVLSGTLLEEF